MSPPPSYHVIIVASLAAGFIGVTKWKAITLGIVLTMSAIILKWAPLTKSETLKVMVSLPLGLGSLLGYLILPTETQLQHLQAFTRYINTAVVFNIAMMAFTPSGKQRRAPSLPTDAALPGSMTEFVPTSDLRARAREIKANALSSVLARRDVLLRELFLRNHNVLSLDEPFTSDIQLTGEVAEKLEEFVKRSQIISPQLELNQLRSSRLGLELLTMRSLMCCKALATNTIIRYFRSKTAFQASVLAARPANGDTDGYRGSSRNRNTSYLHRLKSSFTTFSPRFTKSAFDINVGISKYSSSGISGLDPPAGSSVHTGADYPYHFWIHAITDDNSRASGITL
ncbi:hypothetical protein HDU93_006624 [Gonapodya sp. JEL0774]|nr:hypothetical protein HDU93_006624 [Gonapodya sp. JEL0774]